MKTIVLSNKNNNIHQTIYVTIAKRWINIKGEKALLEDGVWDEYPIEEIANVNNLCWTKRIINITKNKKSHYQINIYNMKYIKRINESMDFKIFQDIKNALLNFMMKINMVVIFINQVSGKVQLLILV